MGERKKKKVREGWREGRREEGSEGRRTNWTWKLRHLISWFGGGATQSQLFSDKQVQRWPTITPPKKQRPHCALLWAPWILIVPPWEEYTLSFMPSLIVNFWVKTGTLLIRCFKMCQLSEKKMHFKEEFFGMQACFDNLKERGTVTWIWHLSCFLILQVKLKETEMENRHC